jgi:hypothetical protein
MSSVADIERAIQALPPEDLAAFRSWFAAFDAQRWDRQIEDHIRAGHLDALADEALIEARAGRCKDL